MALGKAFAPIGSNAKVAFSSITLGSTTTLFGWYKLYTGNPLNNYNPIWGSDGSNEIYYGSGNVSGKVEIVKSGSTIFRSTTSVVADAWRFLVIVDDGAAIKAYYNDVDMGNSIGGYTSLNGMVITKSNQGQNGNNFRGWIDEIGIFARALSGAEITALYNSGAGVYGNTLNAPFSTSLTLGYHLDEGTGSVAADYSGGGRTGTVTVDNGGWDDGIVEINEQIGTIFEFDYTNQIDTDAPDPDAFAYSFDPNFLTPRERYLIYLASQGYGPNRALLFQEGTGNPFEVFTSDPVTSVGSPTWTTDGTYGIAGRCDQTSDYWRLADSDSSQFLTTDRQTVLLIRKKADTTARDALSFGVDIGNDTHRLDAGIPYNSAGGVIGEFGGATAPNRLTYAGYASASTVEAWAFRVSPTSGLSWWKDGVQVASSATVVTRTNSVGTTFAINSAFSGQAGDIQDFYFFALIPDAVSDGVLSTFTREAVLLGDFPMVGNPVFVSEPDLQVETQFDLDQQVEHIFISSGLMDVSIDLSQYATDFNAGDQIDVEAEPPDAHEYVYEPWSVVTVTLINIGDISDIDEYVVDDPAPFMEIAEPAWQAITVTLVDPGSFIDNDLSVFDPIIDLPVQELMFDPWTEVSEDDDNGFPTWVKASTWYRRRFQMGRSDFRIPPEPRP